MVVAGRPRLEALTGLRFVAAFGIFALHAGQYLGWPDPVQDSSSRGFVGVTFFFVLSGFVLTWSQSPRQPARRFWWHRFSRIWPLHAVAWAVALVALGAVGLDGHPPLTLRQAAPNVLLVQSWFPDFFVHYGMNGPSWSLADEAFFYALFPVVLLLVVRRRAAQPPRWAAPVVGACGLAVLIAGPVIERAAYGLDPAMEDFWLYAFPPYRLGEFLLGVALALAMRQGLRLDVPATAVLMVVAGCLLIAAAVQPDPGVRWWVADLAVLPAAVLVVAAVASRDLAGRARLLRRPLVQRLGRWSFAFYLTHWLVVVLLARWLDARGARPPVGVAALVALFVALAIAGLLHERVERPVERWLRARGPGRPAAASAGSTAIGVS